MNWREGLFSKVQFFKFFFLLIVQEYTFEIFCNPSCLSLTEDSLNTFLVFFIPRSLTFCFADQIKDNPLKACPHLTELSC